MNNKNKSSKEVSDILKVLDKHSEVAEQEEVAVEHKLILPKADVYRNEVETALRKLRDDSVVDPSNINPATGFIKPSSHKLVFIGIDASINNLGLTVSIYSDDMEELEATDLYLIQPKNKQDILQAKSVEVYQQVLQILNRYTIAQPLEDDNAYTVFVGIEASAFAGSGRVVDLSYLNGAIIHYANTLPNVILVRPFSPSSVKKFATGNGKADKELMLNTLPRDIRNRVFEFKKADDVADSYWIMEMVKAYAVAYLPIDRLKPEACKPVFDKFNKVFPDAKEFKKNTKQYPVSYLLDITHTFKEKLFEYKYSAKEKLKKHRQRRGF